MVWVPPKERSSQQKGTGALGKKFREEANFKAKPIDTPHHTQSAVAIENVAGPVEEERDLTPKVYTPPNVKCVLMASSFGHRFVKEVSAAGDYNYLVTAEAGRTAHVTKPLIELADEPVLNYWLKSIKQCPRIADLESSVFIVTNADNYDEIKGWATGGKAAMHGGFPAKNIWSTGVTGSQPRPGGAADLAAFLRAQPAVDESHLLVIEADYCFEPKFNLQRILEHSMVRATNCISFMKLHKEEDLSHQTLVTLSDDQAVCPMITSIDPSPSGLSCGGEPALAPVYFLRKQCMSAVLAAVDTCKPWKSFSHLLVNLLDSAGPIHGHMVEFTFNVRSLKDSLFADAFFEEYLRMAAEEAALKANAQDTHSHLTLSEFDDKSLAQAAIIDDTRSFLTNIVQMTGTLGGARSEEDAKLRKLLMEFKGRYHMMLTTRGKGERVLADDTGLPKRFTNVATWKRCAMGQHACYQTTSNEYGLRQPSQHEMPLVWNGTKGQFTNSFTGPPKGASLNTHPTTSRVHRWHDQMNIRPYGAVTPRDKGHPDLQYTQIY